MQFTTINFALSSGLRELSQTAVLTPEALQAAVSKSLLESSLGLVFSTGTVVPATISVLVVGSATAMKGLAMKSILALLAVVAVCALLGVPSSRLAAQAAATGTTQRTVAANQNDQDRWESAIKKFEDADRVTPPPQNAIVFIGASSIVRWNLPESFPEFGPRAINRGFGG